MAKVRREVTRLFHQFETLLPRLTGPAVRRRHEGTRAQDTRQTAGGKIRCPSVAIFAIYQPTGLARSTIETCRYLTSRGYAVLVVSNALLEGTDRESLLQEVWTLIERPNFGYDFGAYREGLRHLWESGDDLGRVLLLNDSTWFPLGGTETTLTSLENSEWDLAGVFQGNHRSGRFLESYFLHAQAGLANAPDYQAEWLRMPVSSNRLLTIRMGERGHSQRLASHGHSLGAVHSNQAFLARLQLQNDDFLHETLRYAAYPQSEMAEERLLLLAKTTPTPAWRERVLTHFAAVLAARNFYNSLPYASVKLMNFPFLKKGRDLPSLLWRRRWLEAAHANALPAPPDWQLQEIIDNTPS